MELIVGFDLFITTTKNYTTELFFISETLLPFSK